MLRRTLQPVHMYIVVFFLGLQYCAKTARLTTSLLYVPKSEHLFPINSFILIVAVFIFLSLLLKCLRYLHKTLGNIHLFSQNTSRKTWLMVRGGVTLSIVQLWCPISCPLDMQKNQKLLGHYHIEERQKQIYTLSFFNS